MTNEELETRISIIESDISKELHRLKTKNFITEIRFESLLRYLILEGSLGNTTFTIEKYQEAVNSFQEMNTVVQKINTIPAIADKVLAAVKFNGFSRMKIYGDDLGLKKIISDAGGTSGSTAVDILANLPCSKDLTNFLNRYVLPESELKRVVQFPDKLEEKCRCGKEYPHIIELQCNKVEE
jgi:hypothetical protein